MGRYYHVSFVFIHIAVMGVKEIDIPILSHFIPAQSSAFYSHSHSILFHSHTPIPIPIPLKTSNPHLIGYSFSDCGIFGVGICVCSVVISVVMLCVVCEYDSGFFLWNVVSGNMVFVNIVGFVVGLWDCECSGFLCCVVVFNLLNIVDFLYGLVVYGIFECSGFLCFRYFLWDCGIVDVFREGVVVDCGGCTTLLFV